MRLTVCLDGNSEGRVLASIDMEEIAKMTITDDIKKSNFNPQMLKAHTDTSYKCGYEKGRADERKKILGLVDYKFCDDVKTFVRHIDISFSHELTPEQIISIIAEQLKEDK